MAVLLGNTSNSFSAGEPVTNVTSANWIHTVGTGENRIIIIPVQTLALDDGGATDVSYAGSALTLQVGGTSLGTGNDPECQIYSLINPPTGANSASVNFTLSTSRGQVGGALDFYNVNQSTPIFAVNSSVSTNTNNSVGVSALSGGYCISAVMGKGPGTTVSGLNGQQIAYNFKIGATDTGNYVCGILPILSDSTASLEWTGLNADDSVNCAIALIPDTSGGAPAVGFNVNPTFFNILR